MKLWARQLAFGLLLTAAIPATAVYAAESADPGPGGGTLPPGDAPSAASAVSGASGVLPPPLETTVKSTDSDDLIGATAPVTGTPTTAQATTAQPTGAPAHPAAAGIAGTAATAAAADSGAAPAKTGKSRVQLAQVELTLPGPVGGYQPPLTNGSVSTQDSLELDIERSMAEIESESSPTLEAGVIYRGRDGQSGLSSLNEVGMPIKGTFSPLLTGTMELDVSPVYLSAGSASGALSTFGANAILAAHGLAEVSPGNQNAAGVLTSIGYSLGPVSGKIGDSAWGFPVNNIIGDIAYQPKLLGNTLSVRIEGQRAPVTDSLLSYAGTHASLGAANAVTGGAFGTNGTWGGVTKTGIRASVFYDNNNIGAFGGGAVSSLEGTNVASNTEIEGFMGAYFRPYRTDNSALRVGIDLIYFGFDKNLSYYTFGQGGYFSPQNYEAVTFPVEYQGRTGRWSYLGSVALGVQHFNQDSSPFFPDNPLAQAALVSAAGTNDAYYGGSSTTGLAVDLRAQLEYALNDTMSVGVAGTFDNGHNYNEGVAQVYLRKTFSDPSPVTPILPATPLNNQN